MNIDQIKQANRDAGQHWFSADTCRFFGTRVLPTVYPGNVFITSEYTGFDHSGRAYTVRQALPDGSIETIGEFLGYYTRESAVKAAKRVGQ